MAFWCFSLPNKVAPTEFLCSSNSFPVNPICASHSHLKIIQKQQKESMIPSGSFEAMISLGSFLFHAPMPWHAFVQNWAMGKQNVWIGVPVKWQPCMCNSRQCTKARQCKVQPHTQSNVSKWTWCHVASIGLVQQGQFCHWLTKMFLCSSFHSNFLFLSGPPKEDFVGWPCFPAKGFLHFLSFRSPQVKSQS